jgi:DNA-binding response OmpR family regulator
MSGDALTVLVVEDDVETARMYAEWLDRYEVRVAHDGSEALERLSPAIDVVLLDRRMPGVSGETVLERVRDGDVDCRVAVVSAVEPDYDVVETGFDDYLQKPVTASELRGSVERLGRRAAYSRDVQRYYALAEQRASLEMAKSQAELDGNPVYRDIRDDLAELESRLDGYVDRFDHQDVRVAFRDAVGRVRVCD